MPKAANKKNEELSEHEESEITESNTGSEHTNESTSSGSDTGDDGSESFDDDEEIDEGDFQALTDRVLQLETEVADLRKEMAELRKLIKGSTEKAPAKGKPEKAKEPAKPKGKAEKEPAKKAKETESKELDEDTIKGLKKADIIAELDKRSISYKKTDLRDVLLALLLKSVKADSKGKKKAEEKPAKSDKKDKESVEEKPAGKKGAAPKKETKAKETKKDVKEEKKAPPAKGKKAADEAHPKSNVKEIDEEDKDEEIEGKNSVAVTEEDAKRGYVVDDKKFVYDINAESGPVIGQLTKNVPTVLSKKSVAELEKLKIHYKVVTASELKQRTKPGVTEVVKKKKAIEIDDDISESKGEKTYADSAAEGEEKVKDDSNSAADIDDPIKGSFEEVNDEAITEGEFKKIAFALESKKVSHTDPIDEIAKKTGVSASHTARIVTRYVIFGKKWPSVLTAAKNAAEPKGDNKPVAGKTADKNVKGGGRSVLHERAGGKK